jgi:hypothetical protein
MVMNFPLAFRAGGWAHTISVRRKNMGRRIADLDRVLFIMIL